jgi:hypothetical protein
LSHISANIGWILSYIDDVCETHPKYVKMITATKSTFELINELIIAISHLLWPIAFLTTVFIFKSEISEILKRIKKGKFFGQELELEREISEFKNVTEKASESIPILQEENDYEKDEIEYILSKSAEDPKIGILLLARQIEKEILEISASTGHVKEFLGKPIKLTFELLAQNNFVSKDILTSVRIFWELRNQIVHGRDVEDKNLIQVLDIGVTLLKTLKAIPHTKHFVFKKNIELYSDKKLEHIRNDVVGIIIENISPNGLEKHYQIFPTTKRDYEEGLHVAWEWSFDNIWDESWYRNPKTNEIESAFTGSAEFVGRPIKEL